MPTAVLSPLRSLARRGQKLLRTLGHGFLFALFGIGAVLLASVMPVLWLILGRHGDRGLLAQRIIQLGFRVFIRLGCALGLLGLEEHGVERLRQGGGLFVANHPTLLDVVFIISSMPQADCVVKAEAWSNPVLRGIVRVAGYVSNTNGERAIQECSERLAAGRSLVVFPEGSRSPVRGLGRFHRGAAHMALLSGAPIIPVRVQCDPPALKRGQPWYKLPNARLDFRLEVGAPIDVSRVLEPGLPRGVAARRLTELLRDQLEPKLLNGPG